MWKIPPLDDQCEHSYGWPLDVHAWNAWSSRSFADWRRGLGGTCLCVFFVRSLSVITFTPAIFHSAVFLLLILLARVLHFCVCVRVQLLPASVVGKDCLSILGIDRATTDQGAVDFCLRTVVRLLSFLSVQAANTHGRVWHSLDGHVGGTGLGRPTLGLP